MSSLILKTIPQFIQDMAAATQSSANPVLDFSVGSVELALLEAVGANSSFLQYLIYTVLLQTRLATSSGTDVDSFGADYGFTRLPSNAATGLVTFSRFTATQAALIVPYYNADGSINTNGAVVKTLDGTQQFGVTVDSTNGLYSSLQGGYVVPAGTSTATVPVQDLVAGSAGNVQIGAIGLLASAIPYIDTVTNADAYTNGADAESDASFRSRFQNFINTRSRATLQAIEFAITSVQQNLTCSVQENVDASGNFLAGNLVVTVDDGSGDPSDSLLATVYEAVDATRAAGVSFAVFGPTVVNANIVLTITAATGFNHSNLVGPVANAITAYVNSLPIAAPLPYSIISKLAYDSTAGIANVTAISVNSGTADIGGGPRQVVKVGGITVN